MEVLLHNNETVEDLCCDGLKLIQSRNEYRFTTDAVLLANFCKDMTGKTCVEFGTGTGVIALLVAHKKHPKRLIAVEIQQQLADIAARNVQLNDMGDVVEVVCGDLKQAADIVGNALVDVVVCNPPYRRLGSGEMQRFDHLAMCRHEIGATLADIIASAAKILNNRGSLYLVHQASRLAEICELCGSNKLVIKEILPVCPRPNAEPNLVLVRAVKCGGIDCVLHAPLSVLDAHGEYSPEAKAWYGTDRVVGSNDCSDICNNDDCEEAEPNFDGND